MVSRLHGDVAHAGDAGNVDADEQLAWGAVARAVLLGAIGVACSSTNRSNPPGVHINSILAGELPVTLKPCAISRGPWTNVPEPAFNHFPPHTNAISPSST